MSARRGWTPARSGADGLDHGQGAADAAFGRFLAEARHHQLGYAGQSGVPEVEAQIQRALQTAQERGIAIGITTSAADAQARIDEGFRFITLGAASPAALADALQALGR